MTTMGIIQPPQIGCTDEGITTNTTMTVMEMKKKRDSGGVTNTSTVMVMNKRDCGDTTNTSTVMETKKRAYTRKDCTVGTNTPTVVEIKKKRAYRRRNKCLPHDYEQLIKLPAPTVMEPRKRKVCGDTNTSTVIETKKGKDCGGSTNTSTVIETKKRKGYGDTNTSTVMELKKRKDCGDTTNTSTVAETKKRKGYGDTNTSTVMEPKKRKYYGDTNTPTMMEIMKQRAYRRKDCIVGTNTPTVMGSKKKRAYRRKKDCTVGINTPTMMEIKKKRACRSKKCLPHDLIVDEILTRLPVPTLLMSALVSKLWYDSIHNDHKRLTYSHFLQSQKQPQVVLSLLNVREERIVKEGVPTYGCHFFKSTSGKYDRENENALQFEKCLGGVVGRDRCEMVGYCHGLPCIAAIDRYSAATSYMISDPNRKDFLVIYPVVRAHIICHGFGFDHTANEYKLVSVFCTIQKEFNIAVFTLGTKSWRNLTATSTPISGHGGRPITKIRCATGSVKSAIYCTTSGGCLVWKIKAILGGAGSYDIEHENSNAVRNNEVEMLLSFNLRDEKFQIIQLPDKGTTGELQNHLLVDYPNLMEFKGSPCIVRIEKISGNGSDYSHRCCDDHQGSSSSNRCCCCCKIHLYVLKDNVRQVWDKEESFDVRINSTPTCSRKLAPDPCCFCFGGTTTPPTHMFGFSDQMLLYWFKGNSLQVYNLRSEKLQLVMPFNDREDAVFRAKMEEPRHTFHSRLDDYCSIMDYQLHRHEENFSSLETFIPGGATGVDADDFSKLDLEPCLGYMFIHRRSKVYYPFYK